MVFEQCYSECQHNNIGKVLVRYLGMAMNECGLRDFLKLYFRVNLIYSFFCCFLFISYTKAFFLYAKSFSN